MTNLFLLQLTSTGKHNFVSWERESHAANVTHYEHIPVGISVSYTITVRADVDCERYANCDTQSLVDYYHTRTKSAFGDLA